MSLPQTGNVLLHAQNTSSKNDEVFKSYLCALKKFERFAETLKRCPSATWVKKFQVNLSICYGYINGHRGYHEDCDKYPVKNDCVRLALDYMKCIDRAFASSPEFAGPIDRIFSPQHSDPNDELYKQSCQALYRCWEALFERGIELMPYRIIAFLQYVKKENIDGKGERCYAYSMGDGHDAVGPTPYWFFDRMNFRINLCHNMGGLIRHFSQALGVNDSYRVTIDYQLSDKDLKLLAAKDVKCVDIFKYQFKQIDEEFFYIHYFFKTNHETYVELILNPIDYFLQCIGKEEKFAKLKPLNLDDSHQKIIDHMIIVDYFLAHCYDVSLVSRPKFVDEEVERYILTSSTIRQI